VGERSRGDIDDALKALMESPDKISTVYEGAIDRIGSNKLGDRKLAQKILSWVVESKRPLSREEFLHALAVRTGDVAFQEKYIIDDLDKAVALCAGLVVVSRKSNTVQLMHYTTRKYFEDHRHHLEWLNDARETVASACITYVSYSAFAEGPSNDDETLETRLSEYPFLRYAAQHWGSHTGEETESLALEFVRDNAKVTSANQVIHLSNHRFPGYSHNFVEGVDGLQTAASFGLARIVSHLIAHGMDPKSKDESGRTALHRAAENGHDEVVDILLKNGATVDAKETKFGQTSLHLAALNGHRTVAQKLLENGAETDLKDGNEWMAIHIAAWTGKEEVVRVLSENLHVNETGKDNLTALHCAAAQGHVKVTQLLIQRGADVNAEDTKGWTPLHWASKKRHDITKPRALTIDDESSTLLRQFSAISVAMQEVIPLPIQERLTKIEQTTAFWQDKFAGLTHGISLNVSSGYDDVLTTLHMALNMHTVVLHCNITSGKKEEQPAPVQLLFAIQDEITALHCAFHCGHERVVKLLLKNGADIHKRCRANVETRFGLPMNAEPTALHLAAFSGHNAVVRLLLEHGIDIHTRSDTKVDGEWLHLPRTEWAALHWAIVSCNEEVVQLLLDRGADIHETCQVNLNSIKCRLTPLQLAVLLGYDKIIRLLISNKAEVITKGTTDLDIRLNIKTEGQTDKDVTLRTRIDLTALHLATLSGRLPVMEVLLESGADIETELHIKIGSVVLRVSTLHIAVICGNEKAVQLLLERGANVHQRLWARKDGYMRADITVLHLAAMVKSKSISELLVESGADVNAKGQIDIETKEPYDQSAKQRTKHNAPASEEEEEEKEDEKALLQRILGRTARLFAAFLGEELKEVPLLGKVAKAYEKHDYNVHVEITPLHIAAMCANDEVVQTLLEREADANGRFLVNINNTSVELTAIHLATIWGHDSMALVLLDGAADILAKLQICVRGSMCIQTTALQLAIIAGNEKLVQLLLAKEPAIADKIPAKLQVNIGHWLHIEATILQLAVIFRNAELVDLLLAKEPNVGSNTLSKLQVDVGRSLHIEATILQVAVLFGNEKLVQLVLNKTSDAAESCAINNDSDNTLNALQLAVVRGNDKIIQLLTTDRIDAWKNCRIKVDPWIDIELTMLHLAAITGNTKLVESLLLRAEFTDYTRGRFHCYKMHAEFTVHHLAAMWRHKEIAELLLRENFDIHAKCHIHIGRWLLVELSVLHVAALTASKEQLCMLLKSGADIRQRALIHVGTVRTELTVLHLAAIGRHKDIVQLFLSTEFYNQDHLQGHSGNMQAVGVHDELKIQGRHTHIEITALHLAAVFARDGTFQILLEHGADTNATCRFVIYKLSVIFSALHFATLWGDEDVLNLLLTAGQWEERSKECSEDLMKTLEGESRKAPRKQPEDILGDQSIEHIDKRPRKTDQMAKFTLVFGNTRVEISALHLAAVFQSPQIINLLLQDGADVNVRFEARSADRCVELTALHLAVLRKSKAMVQYLLENGADVQAELRVSLGNVYAEISALHLAKVCRSPDIAGLLLDNHADLQKACSIGMRKTATARLTVLHMFAFSKHHDIAELMKRGLDVHARCLANIELCLYAELMAVDMDDLMKEIGTNGTQIKLMSFLFTAAFKHKSLGWLAPYLVKGIHEKCSLKLQAKVRAVFETPLQANVDAAFDINMEADLSILHIAATLGDVEMALFLLEHEAGLEAICQINAGDTMHTQLSALHLAVIGNHDGVVKLFLDKDVDVHAKGQVSINCTVRADVIAPHLGTLFGHERVLQLLERDVDIDVKLQANLTALHFSALMDNDVVAKSLLEHGAGVDADCVIRVEARTKTSSEVDIEARLAALHMAAWAGNDRIMKLLLKTGADVDSNFKIEGTVVFVKGARISKRIQSGGTALHLAAAMGHVELLQMLLVAGANANAKCRDGRTPLQWARNHGHDEVVQLIMESQLRNGGTASSSARVRLRQKWHDVFSRGSSSTRR
jgi:ankyrin repeat protein